MTVKIALLTDFHYSADINSAIPGRQGELADIILLRAVHRLNRYIRPDVVFIGGDLINDSDAPDAGQLLRRLKDIIDLLDAPVIAIPGNHDPAPDRFYQIFDHPGEFTDIQGARFVTFCDPEEPGYNARREKHDIERMKAARQGFSGPLVALQHVPVLPPGFAGACPYNYSNANDIVAAMQESGYKLALAGHYHYGFEPVTVAGITYFPGKALCEKPFPYCVIELDDNGAARVVEEQLALPDGSRLTDWHAHTKLAYCNENMDIVKAARFGSNFGLDKLAFAEHSAHLYFDSASYHIKKFYFEGISGASNAIRIDEFFEIFEKNAGPDCVLGMEIDVDRHGRLVIEKNIWDKLQIRLGSVHYMACLDAKNKNLAASDDEFLFMTEAVCKSGIDILAHPFRIFRRNNLPMPEALFEPTVDILSKYGVAAEINYHTNEPSAQFFHMCIDRGVRISFGSDAHNLYEVGEFYPHLKLLKTIASDADYKDILFAKELC